MAIQTRNKIDTNFSTASMSDLVFLLLIFFMLTSTLVAPNAIKLLLPSSHSKTMARQTMTVYINASRHYFLEDKPVEADQLKPALMAKVKGQRDATIVLRADKTVPVQDVVNVIDVVNQINEALGTKHKIILATKAGS